MNFFNANRSVLAVMLGVVLLARPLSAADSATQSLAGDNAAFAFDLYSQLKTADGNLFFSPYSISACLAMTYAGARGDTAKGIAKTLHFYADPVALAAPFSALQQQLSSAPQQTGVELSIANGLWAQAGHPFQQKFLQIATKQYGARLEEADFLTKSEEIRHDINDWVSAQTKGKIADLFPERAINPQTKLALVNAIYFKGRWANPFKTNKTTSEPFTVTHDQKVTAPLMHLDGSFNYVDTNDVQLLELPYGSGKAAPSNGLSMVVLLPKNPDNFQSVEVALNSATLNTWLAAAERKQVSVFLPRFKMTQQFSLNDTLATMGMPEAFSPKADFSGMDGNLDLAISSVVHKAFVEVNEQGTEAAAATGVSIVALAARREPDLVFRADHPFIFLIRDTASGSILFLGRVNNPTK